jgi:hypothetical protein
LRGLSRNLLGQPGSGIQHDLGMLKVFVKMCGHLIVIPAAQDCN